MACDNPENMCGVHWALHSMDEIADLLEAAINTKDWNEVDIIRQLVKAKAQIYLLEKVYKNLCDLGLPHFQLAAQMGNAKAAEA